MIHYCWFGNKPLTPLAEKCIDSWKKYMPNHEIKRWDESNFDVYCNDWCRNSYDTGHYAQVSDYARYWIIYNYGGIYLDTDVELIKSLDDLSDNFFGMEKGYNLVAPGLGFKAYKNSELIKYIKEWYENNTFLSEYKHYLTAPQVITTLLFGARLKDVSKNIQLNEFTLYAHDYLCPMHPGTNEITLTENTHSIHHYAKSWI